MKSYPHTTPVLAALGKSGQTTGRHATELYPTRPTIRDLSSPNATTTQYGTSLYETGRHRPDETHRIAMSTTPNDTAPTRLYVTTRSHTSRHLTDLTRRHHTCPSRHATDLSQRNANAAFKSKRHDTDLSPRIWTAPYATKPHRPIATVQNMSPPYGTATDHTPRPLTNPNVSKRHRHIRTSRLEPILVKSSRNLTDHTKPFLAIRDKSLHHDTDPTSRHETQPDHPARHHNDLTELLTWLRK
jgi:hypothetical protein